MEMRVQEVQQRVEKRQLEIGWQRLDGREDKRKTCYESGKE